VLPVAKRVQSAAQGNLAQGNLAQGDLPQRELAQRIGLWSHQFSPSPARLARIKASIRDFVGCVIAGTHRSELRSALWLAHGGGVPVWGLADSFDAAGAALVAGTAGSLLQLHDFYGPGASHPSSPVIAAAWSALNSCAANSAYSFVHAVAAGYEAANRISDACMPGQILAGSTPTAMSGTFGAAVAAALLHGLDAAGVARSVSNAALLLPAAPIAAMRAHGALVPLHAGLAARAGYEASVLARDADAGAGVLEGDESGPGLIALLGGDAGRIQPEQWSGDTIDSIGWKFFPACFGSHVALEAVLRMGRIDPGSIQRVIVKQPARLLNMVVESGPDEGDLYDRLMSLRWVLARALEQTAYEYPAAIAASEATAALAAKIDIVHESLLDASLPHTLCARIEVQTSVGVRSIDYRRPANADPDSPGPHGWSVRLDETMLGKKFDALSDGYGSTSQVLLAMGITPIDAALP